MQRRTFARSLPLGTIRANNEEATKDGAIAKDDGGDEPLWTDHDGWTTLAYYHTRSHSKSSKFERICVFITI